MTAQMLPLTIDNFHTPTEQQVYRLLQEHLPDGYTVMYSRRWKNEIGSEHADSECDFIITRVGAPILILEVKGGVWECRKGDWYCYGKKVEDGDNPFIQAMQNKYDLIKLLRRGKWESSFFHIEYAVALPETRFAKADMAGMPAVLTADKLDYIEIWIEDIIDQYIQKNYQYRYNMVNQDMLNYLISTLMRDYIVRLNEILAMDDQKLGVFTEQQLQLDKSLVNMRRLTAQGCAGSGKTLMALRQVRRLARTSSVRKILFTCFNRELGAWLDKSTDDIRDRCEVMPFLDFCEKYARQAEILDGKEIKDQQYYDNLHINFLDANEKLGLQYDAIVVDEGQSFQDEWWEVLESLLADKKKSYMFIFYDDFQRIYQEVKNNVPGEDEPFELAFNLRNTANIHRYATKFLPKERLPQCNNVEGEPVWIHFYGKTPMRKVLKKVLNQLIKVGGISAKDIVILTPKKTTSMLAGTETIGPFTLAPAELADKDAVRYATIQSFRGMERKVVIMAEFDKDVKDIPTLHYLGCSRAKTQLVILVSDDIDEEMKRRLMDGAVDKTGEFGE